MTKADLFLHKLKLLYVLLLQSQPHPARADTVINMIMKRHSAVSVNLIMSVFFHLQSFPLSLSFPLLIIMNHHESSLNRTDGNTFHKVLLYKGIYNHDRQNTHYR